MEPVPMTQMDFQGVEPQTHLRHRIQADGCNLPFEALAIQPVWVGKSAEPHKGDCGSCEWNTCLCKDIYSLQAYARAWKWCYKVCNLLNCFLRSVQGQHNIDGNCALPVQSGWQRCVTLQYHRWSSMDCELIKQVPCRMQGLLKPHEALPTAITIAITKGDQREFPHLVMINVDTGASTGDRNAVIQTKCVIYIFVLGPDQACRTPTDHC
jgi:hypothetical protein